MTPIQQLMLGVGAKKKTYLDDVFSTYLYRGNGSARTITNGIDLSGEGGMVYTKRLSGGVSKYGMLWDTINGGGKRFITSYNSASGGANTQLSGFTSSGFTLGTDGDVNANTSDFGSWSFRKAPGFFDMVKYTGNGAQNHQISHNLGCVPGMIIIKNIDSAEDWFVYHRDTDYQYPEQYGLKLHEDNVRHSSQGDINYYAPTSTHFRLGTDTQNSSTNEDGDEYIAYLFGGGLPTTPKRTVWFDGSGDYLTTDTSDDYQIGTSDFTLEYWIYVRANQVQFHVCDDSGGSMTWGTYSNAAGLQKFVGAGSDRIVSEALPLNVWRHIAVARTNGTTKMFVDGKQVGSDYSDSNNYSNDKLYIGSRGDQHDCNAHFSNVRLVIGTALYTQDFVPPTKELTSITNTALLCCNGTTVTSTTTGTVTSSGDPETVTNTPFCDPACQIFGENGDQEIIKCGSYRSSGDGTGEDIPVYLGWEPQWIMVKATDQAWDWVTLDVMRKMSRADGDQNKIFEINKHDGEDTGGTYIKPTSTGFIATSSAVTNMFNNATNYIYVAIRRPDGYVGKPVEDATKVFAMDTGASSNIIPNFDSGFPVDMAFITDPSTTSDYYFGSRDLSSRYLITNNGDDKSSPATGWNWHSNEGFENGSYSSSYQGWMWKRHAGLDVVTYKGNATDSYIGQSIKHSLGKVPEMIIVKNLDVNARSWVVGHSGLHDSTPWENYMILDSSDQAYTAMSSGYNLMWGDGAPSSTHFHVGDNTKTNEQGCLLQAYLFASVDGISKVGSYDGDGSTSHSITTGFTPRFLIIKIINGANSWFMYDSVRGLGSGNDPYLQLENNNAQGGASDDVFSVSSTGFTILKSWDSVNGTSNKYIYYAHA